MADNVILRTIEIDAFLNKHGKRGAEILSVLGRNQDFVEAFRSKLGQELLADAIELTQNLLVKIYENKADDNDKADFRAYKRIIEIWTRRINHIEITKENIKKASHLTRG